LKLELITLTASALTLPLRALSINVARKRNKHRRIM
jgi:hypothetical protein